MAKHFWRFFLLQSYLLVGFLGKISGESEQSKNLGKHVSWEELDYNSEAISRMPEPAGLEEGMTTFLCRAFYRDSWKPGALIAKNGQIYCNVENYGAQKIPKFQMLNVPRGTTSWIPYNDTLPSGAVIGGNHHMGDLAYPCRTQVGSNLYLGNLLHTYHRCHFAAGDNGTSTESNIEIVVENSYGNTFLSQSHACKQ